MTEQSEIIACLNMQGVKIFPKRELNIPEVNLSRLSTQGEFFVGRLVNFLHGVPMGDEMDHDTRRAWRHQMWEQYGEIFGQIYEEKNQFRMNVMARPIVAMQLLAKEALKNHQWEGVAMEAIAQKVLEKFKDLNYDSQPLEEKLKIIHYLEDHILQFLGVIKKKAEVNYE